MIPVGMCDGDLADFSRFLQKPCADTVARIKQQAKLLHKNPSGEQRRGISCDCVFFSHHLLQDSNPAKSLMLWNPLRARKKNQWDIFKAPVPQQLQGGFRKPVWWPPAKARCESDQGLHPPLRATQSGPRAEDVLRSSVRRRAAIVPPRAKDGGPAFALRSGEPFHQRRDEDFRFFAPFGSRMILPCAPGCMTSSWASAAFSSGSTFPMAGRSVPFSNPAMMAE